MKRSEAEAAFKRIIEDEIGNYSHSVFSGKALASRLITLAMNIGMLPPLQKNLDMHTEPYQWEPEDETTQTSNP